MFAKVFIMRKYYDNCCKVKLYEGVRKLIIFNSYFIIIFSGYKFIGFKMKFRFFIDIEFYF